MRVNDKAQDAISGVVCSGLFGCPICGSTEVRPMEIHCAPAGKAGGLVTVDVSGVHLARELHPPGLDAMILLEFCCEKDHAFCVSYAYRRKETVLTLAALPDEPGAKGLGSI